MRRDGVIVPFAAYDGKRWVTSWPAPKVDLDIPITLDRVPKRWWGPASPAAEWQVWRGLEDPAPHTVQVTQPDWVDAHCVRQIGLRTDYHSDLPIPPPTEQPYPKDGLALAPPQTLLPIDVVGPGAERNALADAGLRARFNAAERETEINFNHPIPRRVRDAIEPVIEAAYAFGDAPRTYYVEASRLYRQLGDNGCTVIAFATGWLIRDGKGSKWADMAVDVLPCNQYGAVYMLPLGVLRLGARTYWLAQFSGWDRERYVVVDLKKDKVEAVVSAWGGGC